MAAIVGVIGLLLRLVAGLVALIGQGVQAVIARRERALRKKERLGLGVEDVAEQGERVLDANGVDLDQEPARDLLAALVFVVVCLGRGWRRFDPVAAGMSDPDSAAEHALAHDVRVAGEQLNAWLAAVSDEPEPRPTLGIVHHLAAAFARRVDDAVRAETLLSLDDACLAAGPRTVLQDEMIDLLAETLGVDLVLEGEA
ncbi:hypothetical protein [Arhodomonas sp. AD133]|uniref:hypothetical protein n=1 Tax=Arhodomonas sp. AD133 TaxID=3415009 RepID=UPI003EB8985F